MAESEKTVALQKAYADIILNTAKEAAARIMVSERNAIRFQQDLCCTKDEALRMLVRLKQMIDAKTIEAEMTSLTQQRKIDELEAQLNEAEDVITDLRIELDWVRDKLEKVKNNQVQPLNGQIVNEDAASHKSATPQTIPPSPSNSGLETVTTNDMKNTPLNQRVLDNKCCSATKQTEQSSVSHLDNYYAQHSDLTSIIMRSKEPELYRNGCTQRIRALERNLLNGKLPGDVDDQHSLVNNELIIETSVKDEGKCTAPSPKITNMDLMKNFSKKEVNKPVIVRTLRRKKTRFGKAKATSRKSRRGQFMKPCQRSSVLSRCKTYSINGNVKPNEDAHILPSIKADNMDSMKSSNDLEEELQHKSSCDKDEFMISHKGKRSSVLTRCKIYSYPACVSAESGKDWLKRAENEDKMKPLPCLDPGFTVIKSNVDPISGSTNVTVSVKVLDQSRLVQGAVDKDTELRDESMLVRQEGKAAENLTVPCSGLSPEMVNVPLVYSDLKDLKAPEGTDGSPCKVDGNRLLKYTFQRKRKKESLSDPDISTSPENSTIKRRAGEKQYAAIEPKKSSLANESSSHTHRLAQVARQLISLSGKRW